MFRWPAGQELGEASTPWAAAPIRSTHKADPCGRPCALCFLRWPRRHRLRAGLQITPGEDGEIRWVHEIVAVGLGLQLVDWRARLAARLSPVSPPKEASRPTRGRLAKRTQSAQVYLPSAICLGSRPTARTAAGRSTGRPRRPERPARANHPSSPAGVSGHRSFVAGL